MNVLVVFGFIVLFGTFIGFLIGALQDTKADLYDIIVALSLNFIGLAIVLTGLLS